MRYSLLFLGTSQFAIPILEKLASQHNIVAVITQPDRPVGRKQILTAPPVKVKALELGLKVLQPEKASQIPGLIKDHIDFLVTAAYGHYLPSSVLKMPMKDCLNVHPSLLPKYRGATPMQSALLNGDGKTGVTIIRMAEKIDTGPIYTQQQFPILPEMRFPELEKKCAEVGAELLLSVIKNYHSLSPQEQNDSEATHCQKITKSDGLIYWEKETANEIWNKLRAFTPWPGVFSYYKEQKLNLLDIHPSTFDDGPSTTPGGVFEEQGRVFVQTKKGCIEVKKVQLAGKKEMAIKDFLNGHPDFIQSRVGS